jgi:DNA-binding transcriptional LysR family regulator
LPEDFASVFLSDVLAEYCQLHPRILLNIECDLTLKLFARFKKKEFDLVLVKMSKPGDFPNGIDVWSESLEWVGSPEFFRQDRSEAIPLVLSPQPCVYRSRAIKALEQAKRKWRIVFSSHSYAGTTAAVKAGMGVTVLPRNMVPEELNIIKHQKNIPELDNTHISLLKHNNKNPAVNSFEKFVISRIKQ